MRKLILFDIDGTLVLTGGAGMRAMNRAFEQAFRIADAFAGIPMPGRTDQIILSDALTRLERPLDAATLSRFREVYCEALRTEIAPPHPRKLVMPGIRELLDALSARDDVFVALLTGNFAEGARIKLEHFDLWRYFRCGAYGDDAVHRNDLVAVAVQRAQECGARTVSPADVLVVGDTPHDVACARDAGARSVAVATGSYSVDALAAAGADIVLPDLSDTVAFLKLLDDGFQKTRLT